MRASVPGACFERARLQCQLLDSMSGVFFSVGCRTICSVFALMPALAFVRVHPCPEAEGVEGNNKLTVVLWVLAGEGFGAKEGSSEPLLGQMAE